MTKSYSVAEAFNPTTNATLRIVILDRDGVINYDSPDFIKSEAEWKPLPGSFEAIARLNQNGFKVVVATNQSGLARGLFNTETLDLIHQKMQREANECNAEIDGIFVCPHGPEDNCDCRKPKTGLFQQIIKHYCASSLVSRIPCIGDSLRDLEAAYKMGFRPILVLTGNGLKTKNSLPPYLQNIEIVSDLLEASDLLILGTSTAVSLMKLNMIFRNMLFYLGIIPVTAILTLSGWTLFFTPHSVRYWIITRWSHFFIFWAEVTCGLHFHVKGLENIPKQSVIVFSNHQSTWETVFFQVLLPTQTWILKKELLYIPVFGWGLALIEPIAIKRDQSSQAIKSLIRQGKEKLQLGRFVIIFPEATRVAPGEERRFTRSGAALAHACHAPILPIAHNAGLFWPRGFFVKRPGTVDVVIGPLIQTEGKSTTEINEEAEAWIKNEVRQLLGTIV